jgi:purine-binding chemotaxis protein CheW
LSVVTAEVVRDMKMGIERATEPAGSREILLFEAGGVRFGLYSGCVVEVVIVPLPRAPSIIEGVFDYRGTVVPVLGLRVRFSLGRKPLEISDHLVVLRAGGRTAAFRADRALDLVRVPESDIAAAAKVTPAAEYVDGIARLRDGLVLIHDPEAFLTRAEAEVLETALRDSGRKVGE